MSKNVLVVGWYGHGNLGDDAFETVFRELWGDVATFTFLDQVPAKVDGVYDALIFGGGSFVDRPVPSLTVASKVTVPIGFVGVGIHSQIDPQAQAWLDRAAIVVARNHSELNPPGTIVAPDMLFGSQWLSTSTTPSGILVLGNDFVLASRESPSWQATAWDWFKSELAHTLDLHYPNEPVTFLPMCSSNSPTSLGLDDDRLFGPSVLQLMMQRERANISMDPASMPTLLAAIGSASLVLSLRFHGVVLSTIMGTPFIGISAHDKMVSYFQDNALTNYIDYYGFTGTSLSAAYPAIPSKVKMAAIAQQGHATWQSLVPTIADKLELG